MKLTFSGLLSIKVYVFYLFVRLFIYNTFQFYHEWPAHTWPSPMFHSGRTEDYYKAKNQTHDKYTYKSNTFKSFDTWIVYT